jgi:hypothetical protein
VEINEGNARYRYQLKEEIDYVNDPDPAKAYGRRELASSSNSDYVVEYENIYDEEGRKNWVAGGKVIIKNIRTNELLGELVGYSFDRGLGNTQGERSPWGFAIQCPLPLEGTSVQIRSFVEKVIKPTQGDEK